MRVTCPEGVNLFPRGYAAGMRRSRGVPVASVGDQYSDVAGGHEAVAFKLPNPFSFLP